MDELPWVMLGLRTMPKEDLGTSVADMVYGAPLTIPGAFIVPSSTPKATDHMRRMRDIAGPLIPAPDSWHGTKTAASSRGLGDAEYVFVRRDVAHGPLQKPYTGPYRVLQRHDKYFIIQCGEREESVSVDRLKPANAEPDHPIQPAIPPRRGRLPKQRDRGPVADGDQAETRPETEPEQRPPTYAQVTRRGREVRPPERYIATTNKHRPAAGE